MQNSVLEQATPRRPQWLWVGILALFVAGLALRLICASNDLWFDEIMSINFASEMSGWRGIFAEYFYDNNHYLNTFWIYGLGPGQPDFLYRIPALIAGMMTIGAACWAMQPFGKTSQCLAAVLLTFSYLQIHYSTEARGYAFQILFAVVAFGCLDRFHRTSRMRYGWWFGVFASLALLSHLLTVNFLLACGFWSVSFQTSQPISVRRQVARLATCHLLPFATGLILYYVNVRHLQFGGGPRHNTLLVFASAWSLLIGVSTPGLLRIATGIFAFGLTLAALFVFRKQDQSLTNSNQSWKFFLILLVIIPLVRIAIPSSLLFTRYFLLQITFATLLLSAIGARIAAETANRPFVYGLVILFVALNIGQTSRLMRYGRGSYQSALHWMVDNTEQEVVTISTSTPKRDKPVIEYFVHERELEEGRICITQPHGESEWFIVHETMDCGADTHPPPLRIEVSGHAYRLKYVFEASYLSGFAWSCYRKEESLPTNNLASQK